MLAKVKQTIYLSNLNTFAEKFGIEKEFNAGYYSVEYKKRIIENKLRKKEGVYMVEYNYTSDLFTIKILDLSD